MRMNKMNSPASGGLNLEKIEFDSELTARARKVVMEVGLSPCYRGFEYVVQAICLKTMYRFSSYMELYSVIAALNDVERESVVHCIYYVINNSFDLRAHLSELVGVGIPPNQIRNSLVISYLAHAIDKTGIDETSKKELRFTRNVEAAKNLMSSHD